MYDYGHFCLLILANGTWKAQYNEKLLKTVQSNFLSALKPISVEEARQMSWDENELSPLFDPRELGKSQRDSQIYLANSTIFKEKRGINEGVILFSHNVPDAESFKTFITPFFKDSRIKKIFYLELEPDSYLNSKNIASYLSNLKNLQIDRLKGSEFITLLEKSQLKCNLLYELLLWT